MVGRVADSPAAPCTYLLFEYSLLTRLPEKASYLTSYSYRELELHLPNRPLYQSPAAVSTSVLDFRHFRCWPLRTTRPNLRLQATTSSLPRHPTDNLLQPSHRPAPSSTKFFKAPYLQPSTSLPFADSVDIPCLLQTDRCCQLPAESNKLHGSTRLGPLHTTLHT